jgi:formylglycine-generating enzyme required for sulfatase activity
MKSIDLDAAPDLAVIPPGDFFMGGIEEDKFVTAVELPRHLVTFERGFAMAKTPVTRNQWMLLMGSPPPGEAHGLHGECPVVNVTFHEANGYLRQLSAAFGENYRLPSEAEWEYTCRAGSITVFPHGGSLDIGDANFLYDELGNPVGCGQATPVGQYPPNPLGLFDLLGNVCEWTADAWHPDYVGAPCEGSAWSDHGKSGCRTIRGGAWDHLPRVLRASWRDWAPEQSHWDNLGFRVALSL